jgi:guanosine-3',5'-bis(diphosphate) 3'-pyrophosphohydrolase
VNTHNAHPNDRLARAAVFACALHKRQFRDDGVTPYAVHPLRVTEHLRTAGGERDEDVLIAALLHDTIEDCDATFDTLASRFGDTVAALVAEVTNDNRLPRRERRAKMLEHLASISPRAKRIKLADRLDNVLDLIHSPDAHPAKRKRYVGETEQILAACRGACEPLERALAEALSQLRELVPAG